MINIKYHVHLFTLRILLARLPPLPLMGALQGLEKSPVRGKNSTPPHNGASTGLEKSPVCGKNSTLPPWSLYRARKKPGPWQELHLSPQWGLYRARRKSRPVAQESRFSCPCPMDKGTGKSSSRSGPEQGKQVTGRFDTS